MPNDNVRAELRNAAGDHLYSLAAEEIPAYDKLVEAGEVIRSHSRKKGRLLIIFRLVRPPEPETPKPIQHSPCALNANDSKAFIELGQEGSHIGYRSIERWIGHGLIAARV